MTIIEYLSTYDYIFKATTDNSRQSFSIPYIWQCWLQGHKNTPPMVQSCLKSVQKYHAQRSIKVLDRDSVHNFITIPQYILHKYHQGIIPHAHFCDYIRVALLAKYGGTWIDATVYLSDAIANPIFEQDFFALKFPQWCQMTAFPSSASVFADNKSSLHMRCFSNWFMHSKCNNRLVQLLQLLLEAYWERESSLLDYYIFHIFATYAILKDSICSHIFQNMLEVNNAHAHLLQQCLPHEYDAHLYAHIKQSTTIHKLMHDIKGEMHANSFMKQIISQT